MSLWVPDSWLDKIHHRARKLWWALFAFSFGHFIDSATNQLILKVTGKLIGYVNNCNGKSMSACELQIMGEAGESSDWRHFRQNWVEDDESGSQWEACPFWLLCSSVIMGDATSSHTPDSSSDPADTTTAQVTFRILSISNSTKKCHSFLAKDYDHARRDTQVRHPPWLWCNAWQYKQMSVLRSAAGPGWNLQGGLSIEVPGPRSWGSDRACCTRFCHTTCAPAQQGQSSIPPESRMRGTGSRAGCSSGGEQQKPGPWP